MAAITQLGIGNNTNYESLIQGLMNAERTPITQLQKRTEGLQTQLSAYGKIQSAISALRDAAAKLTNIDSWAASVATSTDAASVQVTAGTTSNTAGSTTVSVGKLATSQSISSRPLPIAPATVGSGSLTIELGKWTTDQTGFTPKSGSTALTINIAPGEDSLTQIRDKINSAKAGVVASIVNDASGARLVMRSAETGESNGFRVTVNDADGGNADDQGLSALAFDPSAGVASMTRSQAAGNAEATLNGLPIVSESNQLKDAIDGLNITLLKPTTADVTLTLAQDKETLKKTVNEFATAYNSVISLLRENTKYDQASKSAGALQGDSTVVGVQGQLRGLMAGGTTLAGTLGGRLADIGLDPGSDGTLKVNATKLDKALGNLGDLKNFFMGLDSANPDNDGFAQRVRRFADQALGVDGRISNRQKGLRDSITSNGKREDALEDRLAQKEKRLRAQYTALDKTMGKMNNLSAYVSQQMQLLR
ncbi:flagellar filament capping protein FliD [Roseateles sp. DAIF2]|uniref:flagellar filament capping protein FliD n=1 Tax=Roseateles sp. DAIF2 TaxID=2714952 RepID=UPI0018A276B1|nr:flagellar filament capping protein FliD [Roseateles sp. DAIF2]QPF73116.1 flagellar filament capping protein FliD [Roseateles sp. DAIF2]